MANGAAENAAENAAAHLRLWKSPEVKSFEMSTTSTLQPPQSHNVEAMGYRDGPNHDCPQFEKHEEATNAEVFYDLFFAANFAVFSEVHEMTSSSALTSYIGFFCMLWMTWLLTGLFAVRFVTDSIFERIAQAGHMGVMIGFAVVAGKFDPSDQDRHTFKTMAIVLCISRILLAIQYSTISWHVRSHKHTRLPLLLMVGMHCVASVIYLGVAFSFRDENTNLYVAFYVVGVIEIIINIGLALSFRCLSFEGTHLINRMSLLTLIIIGEGIVVIVNSIITITKNLNAWTSATIGVVTAACVTVYCVWQIYNDFQRHLHLPRYRQLIWALLHFGYHLVLTLFVEGGCQFITWWKVWETNQYFIDLATDAFDALQNEDFGANEVKAKYIGTLNSTVHTIFDKYPPIYVVTTDDINESLTNLQNPQYLSDAFWEGNSTTDATYNDELAYYNEQFDTIIATVQNSLFATFKIDSIGDARVPGDATTFEDYISDENSERFLLVFTYAFATAGLLLIMTNILFIVSRLKPWKPFDIFRTGITFAAGLSLALIPLIQQNVDRATVFWSSPWMLPTICLVYFVVLVIHHLPKPPPVFFRGKAPGRSNLGGARRGDDDITGDRAWDPRDFGHRHGGRIQVAEHGSGEGPVEGIRRRDAVKSPEYDEYEQRSESV